MWTVEFLSARGCAAPHQGNAPDLVGDRWLPDAWRDHVGMQGGMKAEREHARGGGPEHF